MYIYCELFWEDIEIEGIWNVNSIQRWKWNTAQKKKWCKIPSTDISVVWASTEVGLNVMAIKPNSIF